MAEIWGAVIGGAAVLGAGYLSSQGSKSAANAQTQADQNAIQEQQREFNLIQQLYGPQRNLGYGAMGLLAQLYGLPNPQGNGAYPANNALNSINSNGSGGGGLGYTSPGTGLGFGLTGGGAGGLLGTGAKGGGPASRGGTAPYQSPNMGPGGASSPYASFYNQPGYQFTLNTGLNAINRQASANGSLYSTNNLNQLGTYAEGVASNQYNNYVQQLLAMAGLGGSATAGSAAAATNTGNNISQLQVGQGNSNASGIMGSAGGIGQAIRAAGGYLGNINYSGTPPVNFDPNANGTGSSFLDTLD